MKTTEEKYWRYYICEDCGSVWWAAATRCFHCGSLMLIANSAYSSTEIVAYSRKNAKERIKAMKLPNNGCWREKPANVEFAPWRRPEKGGLL